MSRVSFVTSKTIAKSGKNLQIRALYTLQGSIKLAEPPIPRPASPTAPSRTTAQQNQHSAQNPPASSSSLKPGHVSSSAALLSPLPVPGSSIRNLSLPLWMLTGSNPQQQLPSHYRLNSAGHGIPKPRQLPLPEEDKALHFALQVGEDAYFIAQNGLGVADGVGGWSSSKHATQRPNSSLFSRRLMHFCSQELQNTVGEPDPVLILQNAYSTAVNLSMAEGLVGSSTALLAVLAKDGNELRVAHVGDCCLYLIRDKEIVFRSEEMQHRVSFSVQPSGTRRPGYSLSHRQFNYPLQLGPLSPTTPQQHAQSITLPILEHDVIILSTDGMSDNLWDEDVIEQLSRFVTPTLSQPEPRGTPSSSSSPAHTASIPSISSQLRTALLPTTLSHSLCSRARTVSESSPSISPAGAASPDTPFSRRARQEGIDFVGGKPDGEFHFS
jgi:serine/threonine protein phosphatase PrpC